MPRYPIDRATNFIVEQESWTVVEYDHTSVPGIIYLSLTEGKINSLLDDLENNIADTDKIAKYELLVPKETQIFKLGDIIEPDFTLTKNGVPYEAEVVLTSLDKKIVKRVNEQLTAIGLGEVGIQVALAEYPTITQLIKIKVEEDSQQFSAYIEGSDTIRLDRVSSYVLKGTDAIDEEVTYSVDNLELVTIESHTSDGCVLHANSRNKLGKIILTAEYKGQTYTKNISIISLW